MGANGGESDRLAHVQGAARRRVQEGCQELPWTLEGDIRGRQAAAVSSRVAQMPVRRRLRDGCGIQRRSTAGDIGGSGPHMPLALPQRWRCVDLCL